MTKNINSNIKVSLRPLTAQDVEAVSVWAMNPEVTSFLFWESYQSKEAVHTFLADVVEKHPWFMAIVADDQVVRSLTLDKGNGIHACRAELGYVLARRCWGQGIGTQAVKEALRRGFEELGVQRIEATANIENVASQRVMEKAGMEQEALLKKYFLKDGQPRDHYLYSKVV